MKKGYWDKAAPPESDLQSDVIDFAHTRGWWCDKVVSHSGRGLMDLLCIRRGKHIWLEVKREGEEPRIQQQRRASDMRAHGAEVYAVDTMEQARALLK